MPFARFAVLIKGNPRPTRGGWAAVLPSITQRWCTSARVISCRRTETSSLAVEVHAWFVSALIPPGLQFRRRKDRHMQDQVAPATMKVFEYVLHYKRSHDGNSPSIREICAGCHLRSTSIGFYHLRCLQRAGLIKRQANTARNIWVVGEHWSCPQV